MSKSKVDKNAPKKPKNSYVIFCEENMNSVRSGNPTLKGKEVISLLAKKWKETDEKTRKSFEEKSSQDKQRYVSEMKSYVPPAVSDEPEEGKKRRAKKPASGVKKAPTAYLLFSKDKMAQLKASGVSKKPQDLIKEIGGLWKALPEQQRQPYVERAAALKADQSVEAAQPAAAPVVEEAKVAPKKRATKVKVAEPKAVEPAPPVAQPAEKPKAKAAPRKRAAKPKKEEEELEDDDS